jgi:carboxypeptidase Taq
MTSPEKKLDELKYYLAEINDLNCAAGVLAWDQATYMPSGGASARGRQMATLSRLAIEKFTDQKIGNLLDELKPYEESLPYETDDASLIRITRRDYEHLAKVPPEFVGRFTAHAAEAYQVWAEARPDNDFSRVLPYLEKTLDFSREYSSYFSGFEHIADPLIDSADYGLTVARIQPLFAELRSQLVPLVQKIVRQPKADDSCLRRFFPENEQLKFSTGIIKKFGYDFNRGRLDKTHHPFTTGFSINDVRITTRVDEDFLVDELFSTLHEAGHALYELGVDQAYENTPLAGGTSAGVHESQSRLWENIVGRSRLFWEYYFPKLNEVYSEQFSDVEFDTFYCAINKVEPSLIRVDADEITYNLHVMFRFDLELRLLEGSLAVKDLPEAWRARFLIDFGIEPPNDKDGVMQDVHWYAGMIGGAFQGYTLGNIMSVQFYDAALAANPQIPAEIRSGHFEALHHWLIQNVYRYGRKFTAHELVQRVTGKPMMIDPYINYLHAKYGELYSL